MKKISAYQKLALAVTGIMVGFLPGCVEDAVLNLATPFLLY